VSHIITEDHCCQEFKGIGAQSMLYFARKARPFVRALCASVLVVFCTLSHAESDAVDPEGLNFGGEEVKSASRTALEEVQAISQGIQALKSRVVELNKDLRLMEEKLLFPSSTKYSVFVSVDSGRFFQLEGIEFKLDNEMVASHLYSGKQREALVRGGVHRLYVTNLNEGRHNATVFFTGLGSNNRPYKRAVTLDFDKGAGSGYLEIAISDNPATQEPVFELRQW